MAKVTKIEDVGGFMPALRVTHRKQRKGKGASIRVGCGCCNENLVIFPDDEGDNLIEINGVMGSRRQWQKIFGPLLWMMPTVGTGR